MPNERWNQIIFSYYFWRILESLNQGSSKRVIGHTLEEFLILILQITIARNNAKENTQVQPINQIKPINKFVRILLKFVPKKFRDLLKV